MRRKGQPAFHVPPGAQLTDDGARKPSCLESKSPWGHRRVSPLSCHAFRHLPSWPHGRAGGGVALDSWPFPAPISQVGKLTHTVSADDFPGVAELVGAGLGPRPPPPGSRGDGLDAAVGGRHGRLLVPEQRRPAAQPLRTVTVQCSRGLAPVLLTQPQHFCHLPQVFAEHLLCAGATPGPGDAWQMKSLLSGGGQSQAGS